MRRLLFGLLALVFVSGSAAIASPPKPVSVREFLADQGYSGFTLRKLPTGHETIEVSINGHTGIFVLDSGAGRTVLHKERLAKFGIEAATSEAQGAGAGGAVAITSHPVSSFMLNGTSVPLGIVYATSLDSVVARLQAATGTVIDGVVGQDVLSGFSAIINIGASELYLKLPQPKAAKAS